jgi:RNase P subunit RPR2
MEIFENLPQPLRNISSKEVPVLIQQTLNYQWKAMHVLSKTAIELSHNLCHQFVNICQENLISLPINIQEKICTNCSAFLVPTQSSKIRYKKIKKSKQFKHALITSCLRCANVTNVIKEAKEKKRRSICLNPEPQKKEERKVVSTESKKFSFLDKSIKSCDYLNGDFIPLTSSPTPKPLNLLDLERENKKKRKKKSKESSDIYNFKSPVNMKIPLSGLGSLKGKL